MFFVAVGLFTIGLSTIHQFEFDKYIGLSTSQFEIDKSQSIPPPPPSLVAIKSKDNEREHHADTSVIITSSLIPSHPSIEMINKTMHSLKYLSGLSPASPIFIAVDGLPAARASTNNTKRLAQYVALLNSTYADQSNIAIVPSDVHLHVAGSVNSVLHLVKTKFVYVLQHHFPFRREINHTAIVKSMREYPKILRCVRFYYREYNVI
jgi:hypothetical protein